MRELRICRDGSDFSITRFRQIANKKHGENGSQEEEDEVKSMIVRELEKCRYLLIVWPGIKKSSPWMNWEVEWWMKHRSYDSALLILSQEDSDFGTEAFFSESILIGGLNKKKWFCRKQFIGTNKG